MNDKTQTFEFDAPQSVKPMQNRSENDEYSEARRNKEHLQKRREEEKSNKGLVIIAIILVILLAAAIVTGIFVLKSSQEPQKPIEEVVVEEVEKEEIPPEDEVVTLACNIVFYPDSVMAKNGGYTVLADLYDDRMYKFDNKKLTIDGETDIRQDGKRLTPRALVYIIENSGGDMTVFDGVINEADGKVMSLSFAAPAEEEIPEEGMLEEELPEEEISEEETEAIVGEIIE